MSVKGNSDTSPQNYFGSILACICAGPVDELVSIIIDGKTVWPTDKGWADDISGLIPISYERKSNRARVEFSTPHRIGKGKRFVLTGMADASFDEATPVATVDAYAYIIYYHNVGANVARTPTNQGSLTKVVSYLTNDLVRFGGGIYQAQTPHDSDPSNAPPNPTYWLDYSIKRATSANPVTLTIADSNTTYGQAYFYWGTSTQTLRAGTFLAGHPPYRHFAMLELEAFLFGPEREGPPNIQVVTRKKPNQTLIAAPSAALKAGQANPLAAIAELALDPIFGAGLPAILDATSFQATADAVEPDDDKYYISPSIDTRMPFREFLSKILAYYDGFLRWNNAGLIEAGKRAHGEAPPSFTADNTINFNTVTEKIKYSPDTWAETFDTTTCKFKDSARAYTDAGRKARSGFSRAVLNEPRPNDLDRPWIIREAQAFAYANEWEKIYAQRGLKGTATDREEKALAIKPGDLFLATHDVASLTVICRCIEKIINEPSKGTVQIGFEMERGFAVLPFAPTLTNPTGAQLAKPETITLYQFVQPPPAMIFDQDFQLVILAARKHSLTRGFKVWFLADDVSGDFYQLGTQQRWAVKGTLAQDWSSTLPAAGTFPPDDDTETLQINFDDFTDADDLASIMDVQSEDAINDVSLYAWVFSAADPTVFEVCALKAIRLNAGVYKLKVRRAQFGTPQRDFLTDDIIFIGFRKELNFYNHEKFKEFAIAGTPATFRLQGFTPQEESLLTDSDECPDILFTFADPYAPVTTFVLEQANSVDIASFATVFLPTDVFKIGFNLFSPAGTITDANLVAKLGGYETTLWAQNFDTSQIQTGQTQFTLPQDGTWTLCMYLRDTTGRTSRTFLFPVGSPGVLAPITIETGGGGGSGIVLTPYALPARNPHTSVFDTSPFNVQLKCATDPGVTVIHYQIERLATTDTPVEPSQTLPGAWITYAGAFSLTTHLHSITRIWFFATHGGLTNSPTVYQNY